ncbi:unnamed protein product [Camellia sinensis]
MRFVEIQFDANGRISGAAIRTYLLEPSRVVQITDPERNYHCFYQLCASGRDAEKYKLGHPSHFYYLNQSMTYELDEVNSAEEYMKTRRAMDIVGISQEEQEAIFRTLAAILHVGNIEFSPGKEHDSSVVKDQKSSFNVQMAANLFMSSEKRVSAVAISNDGLFVCFADKFGVVWFVDLDGFHENQALAGNKAAPILAHYGSIITSLV